MEKLNLVSLWIMFQNITYLKEIRDQRSPNRLEYVLGFRESFLPTTISISLNITKAYGIFWLLEIWSFGSTASPAIETLRLSLKLISLSAI